MKWKTKNGDILDVKDMSDSHIRNCIRMLQKEVRKYSCMLDNIHDAEDAVPWTQSEMLQNEIQVCGAWISEFNKELEKRSVKREWAMYNPCSDILKV